MLRDPFLASGPCEFLLLFAAGKASSIQCLQPWHSAAALWPVRDGLHATLSQRRYINWSHRCETSHPISIAIPFILTLSIHRNVHYSLLMSPVHGVFCVFWQGEELLLPSRMAARISRRAPLLGHVPRLSWQWTGICCWLMCIPGIYAKEPLITHFYLFGGFTGSHEFSWSILGGKLKVLFPNGKWSCKSHFHRIKASKRCTLPFNISTKSISPVPSEDVKK